ncbi:MAG: nicotinamide riboside transporter PnuC [Candidatus Nanoarchaeia archaeon]|jgi:nicotinamide mononucleotide transporter
MIELMTIIEMAAVILGLLSVYFTVKQNIWCWPTGLAMVVLYIYIFANAKLYSDMIENVIYIGLQAYGWYHWVYGGRKKNQLPVSRLNAKGIILWSAVIIIGTAIVGYFMSNYTDASLAYPDAFTTVMSLVAQWLMSRKILENWVLWITVDVLALGIYSIKHLYMTTGLYALFLILATMGLIEWYKSMKHEKKAESLVFLA